MPRTISKWFIIKNADKNIKQKLMNYAVNIRKQKNIHSKLIKTNFPITYKYKYKDNGKVIEKEYTSTILNELFFHPNRYSKNIFVSEFTNRRDRDLVDGVAYQQLCREIYTKYVEHLSRIKYKNWKEKKENKEIFEAKEFLITHPINHETKQDYIEYLSYLKNHINEYEISEELIDLCLKNIDNWFVEIHQYQLDYLNNIKAINFKSLTFSTRNVLTYHEDDINSYTLVKLNDKTVIINLKIPNDKGIITLQTKYNKGYFGKIEDFNSGVRKIKDKKTKVERINQTDMNYTLKFLEDGNLKIIFTKDEHDIKLTKQKLTEKAIGVDLNTKNNFLQCSDGTSFNYENYIIKKERSLRYYLKKIANNKAKNKNQNKKHSKKLRIKEEKQKRRRKAHANKIASELRDYCLQEGIKRVVFEDLNISLRTPKKAKQLRDFLQNHLQVALHFNNFKNIAKRILNKAGIEVDFVNPKYTSRTCPVCGHISAKNRRSQEEFKCEHCGHEDNADLNASINILERITNDTFRNTFEYFDKKNKMFKGKNYKNVEFYRKVYQKEKNYKLIVNK